MAHLAFLAVESQPELRRKFFKTSDPNDIKNLQLIYANIERECKKNSHEIEFFCQHDKSLCVNRTVYTFENDHRLYICPRLLANWQPPDIACSFILGLSFIDSIGGTDNYGATSEAECSELDREKSLDNGKNIEWFAWRAAGNTGDEDDDDDDNENKSHAPGWYYNTAIIIRNIAIRRPLSWISCCELAKTQASMAEYKTHGQCELENIKGLKNTRKEPQCRIQQSQLISTQA
ncbi:hypothetical protein MCOR27_006631 [Pyricularia oryzae]|nr:hypothetical protein MCOR27_006631 [Pyricularia oryzae]KAI6388201.1 hypothetical protein MCOR23_010784 [Pyricularia oryzae]KAI6567180.1 hypothetical protein MCOR03_001148 [Pyricularia oryzae]